jgi:hypothetical protein
LEDPGLSLAPGMTQLKEQLPTKCVIWVLTLVLTKI